MDKKIEFLDSVAEFYDVTDKANQFDYYYKKFHFQEISKNIVGKQVLELGCSTGLSTFLLSQLDIYLTVVEGSKINIEKSNENFEFNKNVKFINTLWEDFESKEKFTDILLVDSFQLLENKKQLLKKYQNLLTAEGRFHLIFPNSNSLHRQIGVEMGLIESLTEQSDMDKLVNSNQTLDWNSSRNLLTNFEFEIEKEIPILLKPLDNKSMLTLAEDQINAYFLIAKKYKDICSHMYFVLKNV